MKTYLIATTVFAAMALPAFADGHGHDHHEDALMTACMQAVEAAPKLPEGVTAADLKPNCECLVEKAGDDVRPNLLEVANRMAGGEADAKFSEAAQQTVDSCFPPLEE